ncbi:MAG TPA: CoA pyrophosphatase [Acidobacteriota bacterium]|nr:CoA pyrophosphatase [Acidobacteriota bacterium]
MVSIESIQERLSELSPRRLEARHNGRAAVLMPLFLRQGKPHFLLTQRTQTVATHKGQVSFPGGYREGDERLRQTALRETREEVGIASERVRLLGPFHEYMAVTETLVRPYVGLLRDPWEAVPNPDEVARVLEVPLRFFSETVPRSKRYERLGRKARVYFWDWHDGTEIWGLTASMIKDFLDFVQPKS